MSIFKAPAITTAQRTGLVLQEREIVFDTDLNSLYIGDGTTSGGLAVGGGGSSDHGTLTGLGDDDHTQYHNDARGDARYTPLSHVGTGGAAHANVVAAGAAGFMTGADKTKLDGIATGATANVGTVTSVAASVPTGLSLTGSPITVSGTLAFTWTAGYQGYTSAEATKLSGIATGATVGADWSVNLTNIPANITSWAGIAPSAKQDALTSSTSNTISGTQVQRAALTGDVTASANSNATTIANSAVTLAKMADVATGTVFYRKTAATGIPEVQTLATLKTDLGLTGTNSGDQTITLTSDVTGSGTGSFATTIAAGAVTLAKMANVATGTVFYRKTAATGAPEVQTLATLKTDLGLTGTNSGDQTSIVGITGTKAQFDTAVTDGNFMYIGDAPTAHTHLLAAGATDVTMTAANLNTLDDGVNTSLHFHDSDRARANHTGTQTASTISDFSEAVDDRVGALLVAGTNITLNYNDAGNSLTINAAGGGGSTNLAYTASPTDGLVTSDTGTDATLTLVDGTNAGLMAPAQHTKLAGIATGATANSSDATLLARANHTGTQTASTISDWDSASRAQTEAMLIAGANVTLTPAGSGATRTITVAATGGGGGGTSLPRVMAVSSLRI